SSGTARKTVSHRAATSAGVAIITRPGITTARLAARSEVRAVTATTGTPALASSRASVVPTAPAPTKPTLPSAGREPGKSACTVTAAFVRPLVQVFLEQAAGLWVAQLTDRALLYLAYALACHFELAPDLFERVVVVVEQAKA